jgi:Flp pilus assembly protein CpaB
MKQKNLVLMVVAVGCGLVAAFLTSQMSARTSQVETQDVIVATKDLPVGMMITKDELPKVIKHKKVPKDGLPPGIVETEDELLDKRLSRAIRAEETINKADLTKGGFVTIPPGMHLLTLQLDVARAAAGFAGPGSHVDILASLRLDNKLTAMPILVNMLVLAVDGHTTYQKDGVFQSLSTVSFAANRKQGLVLELAKARGCQMSLLLRNPEDKLTELDQAYDIDRIIRLLSDEKNPVQVEADGGDTVRAKGGKKGDGDKKTTDDGSADVPAPRPKQEMVKVPCAVTDIKPGTEITKDLINDPAVFGTRELPKDFAEDAVTDLTPFVGEHLKNGLGKGQWVTKGLVGGAEPKPSPRDSFNPDKGGSAAKPAAPRRNYRDVTVHTTTDTKVYRYEEVEPGRWRSVGEVRPGLRSAPDAKPEENEKSVD